jgi:hypothetical protein
MVAALLSVLPSALGAYPNHPAALARLPLGSTDLDDPFAVLLQEPCMAGAEAGRT